MPRALVIRTAGTNCDAELVRAFSMAGAEVALIHLDRLIADPRQIDRFDLVGFPGGFSYGDDVASGRIFAMKARLRLWPALRRAAERGCPMIGVCNGFQILVQLGLLPGRSPGEPWPNGPPIQLVTLATNQGGSFIDEWVRVAPDPNSMCIWTHGLAEAYDADGKENLVRLPIAHGEGRFVARDESVISSLRHNGQIALRYVDNPNGSAGDIAGICDTSGRIFGLMPHPERYIEWTHHPFWTRLNRDDLERDPPGLLMFRNAVQAAATVPSA